VNCEIKKAGRVNSSPAAAFGSAGMLAISKANKVVVFMLKDALAISLLLKEEANAEGIADAYCTTNKRGAGSAANGSPFAASTAKFPACP
jgi:hypothetical protein